MSTGSFLFPFVPLAGIIAAGYLVASTHLEVGLVLRRR
jgi:hypothetical protein